MTFPMDPLAAFQLGIHPQLQNLWNKQETKFQEDLRKLQQIEILSYLNPLGMGLGSGSEDPDWLKALLKSMNSSKNESIDKGEISRENAIIQAANNTVKARNNRCGGEIKPKYKDDGSLPKGFEKSKTIQDFKSMDISTIDKILSDYKVSSSVDDAQTLCRSYLTSGTGLLGEDNSYGGHPFMRRTPLLPGAFMSSAMSGLGQLSGGHAHELQAYTKDAKLRRLLSYLGCDTIEVPANVGMGFGSFGGLGGFGGFGGLGAYSRLGRGTGYI